MAIKISVGKDKLKELGLHFIVANVPVFVIAADPNKTHKMQTVIFNSLDEIKEKLSKEMPIVVFDEPAVYKEKANRPIKGNVDVYAVRYAKIDLRELEMLRSNLKEMKDVNYSFKWDLSCWFGYGLQS